MRLIIYLFIASIAFMQLEAQTTYSLQPGEPGIDGTISKLYATSNFSLGTTLRASRTTASMYERSLIKFDLSALQPGIKISSARLVLYGISHSGTGDGGGILQMVPDTWDESKATWNNSELLSSASMPSVSLSTPTSSSQNYTLNVTSMVQAMVNTPLVNFGWLLKMSLENGSSNRNFEFGSSDNGNSALRPRLEIVYAQALSVNAYVSPADQDTSHNGGVFLDVSGGVPPYTYSWSNSKTTKDNYNITHGIYEVTVTDALGVTVVRPVPVTSGCGSTTFSLNFGTSGTFNDVVLLKESFNSTTQNRNFESTTGIVAYNKSSASGISVARSLLSFDLNSIPPDATINSAILKLTDNESTFFAEPFPLQLCRVTQSWNESTVTRSMQPTYNDSVSDVIEIDYDGTDPLYQFDVTNHLQKMVTAGDTKAGWLLKLKSEMESEVGQSAAFIGNENGSGTKPTLQLVVTLPDAHCNTTELNWHQEDTYDENGTVIGSRKIYFDNMGRRTQNQVKNANNEVFTSQTLYDAYSRPAIDTKAAYTGSQLIYNPGFMRTQNGQAYQYTNFDISTKLNNPDAIENGIVNTLGSYYSNNNTYDPYQAIADNPYTRMEYEGCPGGAVRRVSKPGNAFKMGSNREDYSFSMISGNELKHVYGTNLSYKAKESSGNVLDCTPFTISNQIVASKEIIITPDNLEMISYSVGDKLLATCYSGLNADACSYTVSNTLYYDGTHSTDIHLPHSYKNSLALPLPTQLGDVSPMSASNITFKLTDLYRDKVLVEGTDYFVDNSTRLVTFDTPLLSLYPGRGLILRISFEYNSTYETGLIANGQPPANVVVNYVVDYGRFSKNYYDLSGLVLKSVSPKGFACNTPTTITMANTYNYSYKGQLVAKQSPDEGIVEMMYDTEGKLRFTQNAEQKTGNRFSYTNYDKHGRAYETGEYQSVNVSGSVWFNWPSSPASGIVYAGSITNQQDGLPGSGRSLVTTTSYTAPATGAADDIPNSYSYYNQYNSFRNGQVNFVKNQNATIWFNYDKVDRKKATITQITEPDFIAKNPTLNDQIKTSESSYNYFTGITNSSTYQLNNSNEKLLNQFTYDVNYRPVTYSVTYGSITQELSKNFYNKSGQLKRVVNGKNLQGTDFIYTIHGNLKAINHPALDPAQDPGGDNGDYIATNSNINKDLFGEQIDYYANDYERNNTYISNSISVMNSKYNNLIYAARFKTRGTVGPDQSRANFVNYGGANQDSILTGSVYAQKEFRFAYTYDQFNQLATSVFGTYNNSTGAFSAYNGYSEKGASNGDITYDRNGNITSLVRNAYRNVSNNTPIVLDNLTYTVGSSNNQVTAIVDAASNSFTQSENFRTPSLSSPSSFLYNSVGQMTQSPAEDIASVTYFPDGKVKMITCVSTSNTTEYEYGPGGNKLKSKYHIISGNKYKYTWYVGPYIYEYDEQDVSPAFKIAEAKIGGGVIRVNNSTNVGTGYIVYHVSDHLGNIRATYKASGSGNGLLLLSRDDYYAFGGRMPGRSWQTEETRYAYQGKEKANASNPWDQFELRMYNHDLGRWFAPDPYGQFASPYLAFANNPVSNIDPDGGWVNAAPGLPNARFVGAEQMRWQREVRSGAFSVEWTQKRYNDRYENLKKQFREGDPSIRNNVDAFLDAVHALNNEFYGLTYQSGAQPAYNAGFDALTMGQVANASVKASRNGSYIKNVTQETAWDPIIPPLELNRLQNQIEDKSTRAKGYGAAIVDKVEKFAIMAQVGGEQGDGDDVQTGTKEITYYSDGSSTTIMYDMNGKETGRSSEMATESGEDPPGSKAAKTAQNGGMDKNLSQNQQSGAGLQGGEHLVGPALFGAGQPYIYKNSKLAKAIFPRSTIVKGASKTTSFASLVARRIFRSAGLNFVGGVVGKAIPVFGWGLTVYDAGTFLYNNREEIQEGMQARDNYIQQELMPLR